MALNNESMNLGRTQVVTSEYTPIWIGTFDGRDCESEACAQGDEGRESVEDKGDHFVAFPWSILPSNFTEADDSNTAASVVRTWTHSLKID